MEGEVILYGENPVVKGWIKKDIAQAVRASE